MDKSDFIENAHALFQRFCDESYAEEDEPAVKVLDETDLKMCDEMVKGAEKLMEEQEG